MGVLVDQLLACNSNAEHWRLGCQQMHLVACHASTTPGDQLPSVWRHASIILANAAQHNGCVDELPHDSIWHPEYRHMTWNTGTGACVSTNKNARGRR